MHSSVLLGRSLALASASVLLVGGLSTSAQAARPTCAGHPATIVGTSGNDTLRGTAGPDVIVGLAGYDRIDGAGGNDLICGGDDDDTIHGGPGNDRIDGGAGSDVAYGDQGDDILRGHNGADTLYGDAGRDRLFGGYGRLSDERGEEGFVVGNRLYGGPGDDELDPGSDPRSTQGPASGEILYQGAPRGVRVDLAKGVATGWGTDHIVYRRGMQVSGTPYADRMYGGQYADHLTGLAGRDLLVGRGGDDTLAGDQQVDMDQATMTANDDDTAYGGPGADFITSGSGLDHFYGGDGDDNIVAHGRQPSRVFGQGGNDSINLVMSTRRRGAVGGGPGTDSLLLYARTDAHKTLRIDRSGLLRMTTPGGTGISDLTGVELFTVSASFRSGRVIYQGTNNPDRLVVEYTQTTAYMRGGNDRANLLDPPLDPAHHNVLYMGGGFDTVQGSSGSQDDAVPNTTCYAWESGTCNGVHK